MAADIKVKYPATSSVALTITLASLASSTTEVGRASTAVDNTTNLDLDHLLAGLITTGTSPTGGQIEVWVYGPRKVVTGTPTYPDSITGTDAGKTMTSTNVKNASLRLAAIMPVDTNSNRGYDMAPVSVASLFGGQLPPFWGVFVVHNTGVNLHATGGNHELHYERVQAQTV